MPSATIIRIVASSPQNSRLTSAPDDANNAINCNISQSFRLCFLLFLLLFDPGDLERLLLDFDFGEFDLDLNLETNREYATFMKTQSIITATCRYVRTMHHTPASCPSVCKNGINKNLDHQSDVKYARLFG